MKKSLVKSPLRQQKQDYWKEIIEDWQKSELSQQRYCATKKINFNTFTYWRGNLKDEADEEKAPLKCNNKFTPITIVSSEDVETDNGLILYLRNGRKIKISKRFDEETLQRLLRCIDV